MGFLRFSRGLIEKVASRQQRKLIKTNTLIDPLQKYMTVGEYQVGADEDTPNGKNYTLTVYKDDKGILHQALSPESTKKLAPEYERRFNPDLGHYRAFRNVKTGRRYLVEQYLRDFYQDVEPHIRKGDNSVTLSVITDTHFKNKNSMDYYGWNGLQHVKEFSYLDQIAPVALKVHLGDWIDGSDAGLISESELTKIRNAFRSKTVPYIIVKGNHDENDKFDEMHDLSASFPEKEFDNIMWPGMYNQARIHYISRQHGVCYYDFGDLRVIAINTSDVPYILDAHGKKRYDTKLVLGVREDQIEEIIEILTHSSNKKIIFLSHANPINRKGGNALKFNGRSLHELLVAFNQREKGKMHSSHDVPPEFRLSNDFDFTKVKDTRIVAYFCGHRHHEDQFRINGIQYIIFNCSALMGPNHSLTTKYNKTWNRQIDTATEAAGYLVNVDLVKHRLQVFGYGASSRRRIFFI